MARDRFRIPGFPPGLTLALTLALALAGSPPAMADVTLVYGEGPDTGEQPVPTHQIQVRAGKVSIATTADKRVLVYESGADRAVVVDHRSRNRAALDADGVRRLAARLAESQRQALQQIEEKLANLPKEERDQLRETIDLLRLASQSPESLAAPVFRSEETGKRERFLELEAVETILLRNEKPEATVLVAGREAARVAEEDFRTLERFQSFLEGLTKGLPPDMQSWIGLRGLISPDGRLALRVLRNGRPGEGGGMRLELLRIDREPADPGWFEVPAEFAPVRWEDLYPIPSPAPGAGNVLEK